MQPHLVLASASPRRRQILALLGAPFEPIAVDLDESPLPGESPAALAERLARAKATAGAERHPNAVVIGSDTVVALDEASLGKPATEMEAYEMLTRLRGRSHQVITGVAAARLRAEHSVDVRSELCTTEVWMRSYSNEEIRAYIATGDPFDKAGSYAIQHAGFHPVARIEGCFLNVVGLPLPTVRSLLIAAEVPWSGVSTAALEHLCPNCADRHMLALPAQPTADAQAE